MISQNTVKGELIDIDDNKIVDVSVKLINLNSEEIMHSTISNSKGLFIFKNVLNGNYTLIAEHLYFQNFNKTIQVQSDTTDLGILRMENNELEEVVITNKKSKFEYKVDRKVIRPIGADLATNAVDLLRGIPSIEVDMAGKIKYRGGGAFKVYINERPVKNGTERLLQLSSEQIERIEIITNPSAEYSAEGIAGIISVILKKNMLDDFSIRSNVSGTTIGDLNSYLSATKKFQKFSIGIILSGGNYLWYKGINERKQTINISDSIKQVESRLTNKNSQTHFNTEINSEIELSSRSKLGISFNITPFNKYNYDKNYGEFTNKIIINEIMDNNDFILESLKKTKQNLIGSTIDYQFKINDSTKIATYLDYSTNMTPFIEEKFDHKIRDNQTSNSGYHLSQREWQTNANVKYDKKFENEKSLNFGIELEFSKIFDFNLDNEFFGFKDNYKLNQKFSFARNTYSGFINYSFAINKLNIQLGSRVEQSISVLNFSSNIDNEKIENDKVSFFPSLYFLYNFTDDSQLGLNYSKRTNRPDGLEIAPIIKYVDPYSIYYGNSNISFYNSHSFELNYRKQFDQSNTLSIEAYHQIHNNSTEELSAVDETNNILIVQPYNVGSSYVWGAEFLINSEIFSFWNIDLGASAYHKKILYNKESLVREHLSYDFNLNNSFQLEDGWSILYNMNYYGPILYAQSNRKGYFFASASLTKTFSKKRWTIGISNNNIFNSLKFNYNSSGSNFSYSDLTILKPYFQLKVSYNFKK